MRKCAAVLPRRMIGSWVTSGSKSTFMADCMWQFRPSQSIPKLNVAPRRVFNRLERPVTGNAGSDFGLVLALEPGMNQSGHHEPGCSLAVAIQRSRLPLRGRRPVQYWYFFLAGGLTTPSDVTRAREHVFHTAAEIFAAEQDRFCRRDVVLARGQVVDRHLDRAEIDWRVADRFTLPWVSLLSR